MLCLSNHGGVYYSQCFFVYGLLCQLAQSTEHPLRGPTSWGEGKPSKAGAKVKLAPSCDTILQNIGT
uniref:Uncharacterized protein n=1 Tax=Romanomermis culicivorax TaxID=13658 RepID=A0A915KWZ8_ROMCU